MVGKSDFKENPKSDLDLDLGFVNYFCHLPPRRPCLQSAILCLHFLHFNEELELYMFSELTRWIEKNIEIVSMKFDPLHHKVSSEKWMT